MHGAASRRRLTSHVCMYDSETESNRQEVAPTDDDDDDVDVDGM